MVNVNEEADVAAQSPGASLDDFQNLDLGSFGQELNRTDEHALEEALDAMAKQSEEDGDAASARALRLLLILCTFHLSVSAADVWGPRWQTSDRRSFIPSDFRGEQTDVLALIADHIGHPGLRARVADIVWTNDRSLAAMAATAISAYCEMIQGRLSGRFGNEFEELDDAVFDAVDWLERALQIAALSGARRNLPQELIDTVRAVYAHLEKSGDYVPFERVARLGRDHGLLEWETVAAAAERIAVNRAAGDYPMAVQTVLNLAVQGYGKVGDDEAKRRCQELSVAETLRMREQNNSAAAQAYWTRKAIGELRAAGGFRERVAALRTELRDLQDAALDEYCEFSIPMDLGDEQRETVKVFEKLSLPDILWQYAILSKTPTVEHLREQAEQSRKSSVLGSLFGASYTDNEGKTIAESDDGDWVQTQSLQYLDIWRHQVVAGFIEPARHAVMTRFTLEERHFEPLVSMSPFVPPGHEHLFALGFTRHWQGDHASAAYLLIPQLENSIRHVLINAGREPTKIRPDLLQEDISLSGMIQNLRPTLKEVFGADITNEIDLLFNFRAGPSLRHDVAHGKLAANACYHPSVIYACWMIYRLTCLPLAKKWTATVGPAVEQAAFGKMG